MNQLDHQTAVRAEQAALAVRDLTVSYAAEPVLWDVDLDIPAQSLCAVVGPNGAGKSTLLKAILGLVPVSAGTVWLQGSSQTKGKLGYVPQRNAVDWDFPTDALDVVTMGTYGRLGWFQRPGKNERDLARHCLERVGMADFARRQISELSGGQQQRVFLARALAQQAPVTLMDEPFAGVDDPTQGKLVQILQELRQEGKTILVVHHDLDTVANIFDRVVFLNRRVIATGPVGQIFNDQTIREAYASRPTLAPLLRQTP